MKFVHFCVTLEYFLEEQRHSEMYIKKNIVCFNFCVVSGKKYVQKIVFSLNSILFKNRQGTENSHHIFQQFLTSFKKKKHFTNFIILFL